MIEYLILLMLVKYRDGVSFAESEQEAGPYAGLFIDDEPPPRKRPELRLVSREEKWQP